MNELKRTFILKSSDPDVIETAGVDTFEMPIDDVIKYFQVSPLPAAGLPAGSCI